MFGMFKIRRLFGMRQLRNDASHAKIHSVQPTFLFALYGIEINYLVWIV